MPVVHKLIWQEIKSEDPRFEIEPFLFAKILCGEVVIFCSFSENWDDVDCVECLKLKELEPVGGGE